MVAASVALPSYPTPLIGREAEIAAVVDRLGEAGVRLFTLVGVGGIGKTRLALAVAERAAPAFADGVVLVDLQPVSDPARVLRAIGEALGVVEAADRPL